MVNLRLPIIEAALLMCALVFLAPGAYGKGVASDDVRNVLRELDKELNIRDSYLSRRHVRIDSLRSALADSSVGAVSRVSLMEKLGREYASFNNDSALYYFVAGMDQAVGLGLDSMAVALKLRRLTYLPLAGFYAECEREFAAIDPAGLPSTLKTLYYDAGRQMYSYTAAYFKDYPEVYEQIITKANAMQTALLTHLPPRSALHQLNQGEYFFKKREYAKAEEVLSDLINRLPEDDNLYARATHILADIARERGESDTYLYYLTRSAISDLKGGTLEVSSLQELGKRMFDREDIGRAHRYLSIALRNAVECNALLRVLESSRSMPLIESAHAIELGRSQRLLQAILAVMLVLLVGLVVVMVFLRREMRRLNDLKERLGVANRVKEIYISQFLNLCSVYMDKLNQFCKVAHRKISTGKVDDLYKLTKSGKFVEEQSKEFYEVFDEAFLHLYPTFLTDVNKLLRDDQQIVLKEGEKLNTDLRILAFMRLGIEESTRIAQVLNYSVYTIYTYRNKLRNRAIARESFEADVMKIGAID